MTNSPTMPAWVPYKNLFFVYYWLGALQHSRGHRLRDRELRRFIRLSNYENLIINRLHLLKDLLVQWQHHLRSRVWLKSRRGMQNILVSRRESKRQKPLKPNRPSPIHQWHLFIGSRSKLLLPLGVNFRKIKSYESNTYLVYIKA